MIWYKQTHRPKCCQLRCLHAAENNKLLSVFFSSCYDYLCLLSHRCLNVPKNRSFWKRKLFFHFVTLKTFLLGWIWTLITCSFPDERLTSIIFSPTLLCLFPENLKYQMSFFFSHFWWINICHCLFFSLKCQMASSCFVCPETFWTVWITRFSVSDVYSLILFHLNGF